tara:strand:- start:778 stop:1629 length:852 start_codon:yes stop_codon:yes gene_type:complete
MGYDTLVSVKKSEKSGKDYTATFRDSKTGKEKKTHFGDATMDHYNVHRDKNRREKYRSRHKKDLNTGDPTRAGYLSYYLLWGESTSLRTNLAAFRKRFFPKSAKSPTKKTSSKRKMNGPGKPSSDTGLGRWFKEDWRDEEGNVCGSSKNKNTKKCRPKNRIAKGTPVTWNEMSPSQKSKAVSEKKQVGMGAKASPIRKGKVSGKKKTSPVRKSKKSEKKKTSPTKKMKSPTSMNTPLCPRGKSTAKSKFKVYPSAYANGYAVQVCKGTKPDLSGKKKCSPPYC